MSVKTDREDSAVLLRSNYLERGDTLYTVLRTVARSGMSRTLDVYTVKNGEIVYLTGHVASVLGSTRSKDGALKVSGGGMDMGFHVVYGLSQALFGDGYALTQRWL